MQNVPGPAGIRHALYEYGRQGIADDFWVLATAEYVTLMGL